ncbi:hypothetical protein RI367_003941 [Sorochytrium milnesiophthora]
MQNDKGDIVDLYIPRKCSATNRLITAKDHASVQINIAEVDERGRATGAYQSYALSGFVRANGESDDSLNRLAQKDGYLKNESAVVKAPIEQVWAKTRDATFKFWSIVSKVDIEDGLKAAEVGSVRKVTFKDGTVQRFKLLELSDLEYFATYEVIESTPAVTYSSAVHTIRLRRITKDNTTFVEWYSDFSGDAGADVISDAKYKKKDGLDDLAKHF